MRIGMIGLGRMGMNMSLRLMRGRHEVSAFDLNVESVRALVQQGARGAATLEALVHDLQPPRVLWLMVPAGDPVEKILGQLAKLLAKGDLVIDGGNSFYQDDVRRAAELAKSGIRFMDVGVSGGIWGLENGFCMMAGGNETDFKALEPALRALAPENGYLHCGPVGAGHFVKMIHNGIEYGMMQAYGEGFEILQASPYPQDLAKVSGLWNRGSVVRSWLLELAERAFQQDPDLKDVTAYVEDSGEGRWTVKQAVDTGVSAPVITAALYQRFLSRQKDAFSLRVLAALRNQFGGHAVARPGQDRRSDGPGAGGVRPASPDGGDRKG